jgi:Haloacid dehalogenase-like hydrolase
VADLGPQVVLATSAPEDELAMLRDVLDCDDVVSEVTTSRDVDIAKPQPDIIRVALDRAGVTAEKAVFIGDAVGDVEACLRATVPYIGVLTGGAGRAELRNAGANAVFETYRDCAPTWPAHPPRPPPSSTRLSPNLVGKRWAASSSVFGHSAHGYHSSCDAHGTVPASLSPDEPQQLVRRSSPDLLVANFLMPPGRRNVRS